MRQVSKMIKGEAKAIHRPIKKKAATGTGAAFS
jgi:hypothetical protein